MGLRTKAAGLSLGLALLFGAPSAEAEPSPSSPAEPKESVPPHAVEGAQTKARPKPDWTELVRLSGGIALYYYQPTNGWDNLFLIYPNLRFDAEYHPFGLHFQPRLSSEKMRPYYDGLAWVQEAYVFVGDERLKLKIGKIYKQLGLFWDGSFYGNIQVYEGLKFDPNSGFSLESSLGKRFGLDTYLQFFVTDGHTNASLTGRDTISIPGARRRNTLAARLRPFVELAASSRLELGLSAERFTADLPSSEESVRRLAADVKLTWGGFGAWGEVLHQSGSNVTDFPYAGDSTAAPPRGGRVSADNLYLLAGAEYALGPVTLRYNFSMARYRDVQVEELLHLPAVVVALHPQLSFFAEYASWPRRAKEGTSDVDQSLNLTWIGRF